MICAFGFAYVDSWFSNATAQLFIFFQELRRRLANITKDAYYYISKSDTLKSIGAQIYILYKNTPNQYTVIFFFQL